MLLPLRVLSQLTFAFPDILSALSLIILIVLRNFLNKAPKNFFPKVSLILSLASLLAILIYSSFDHVFKDGIFVYSYNLTRIKIILLAFLSIWLLFLNHNKLNKSILNPDFFIFIYGMVNAMMLCLSAHHFIILILGLELYTFSLAFLVINSKKVSPSVIKCVIRFILVSSVMSAILIFGCSILYSKFEGLSFMKMAYVGKDFESVLGTSLILCAMMLKLGCAPLHSWMLDVYEESSTQVVMFLDIVWKFFMTFVFIRVISLMINGSHQYRLILASFSVFSMLVGAVLPIFQNNIHRFIASSSIGHLGFVLSVFSSVNTIRPLSVTLSYLGYYSLASLCFFLGIILIKNSREINNFQDLKGIVNTSPLVGFLILFSMLAMIGLPPFGNFIAKLNMFRALIDNQNYLLLSVSILYSVISLIYIIKWGRFFFKSGTRNPIYLNNNFILPIGLIMFSVISLFLYNHVNQFFVEVLSENI